VPPGWEGLHLFDISDKENQQLVGSVQTRCGSHTATAVRDKKNGRLLVYSSSSAHSAVNPNPPATGDWIDIVEIPLDDPGSASLLREKASIHTCHDIGVILGDVMKAACSGGTGFRLFSLGGPAGGSLEDPLLLDHADVPGVTIGHSAAFSWDGEIVIFGHEPGGGVAAACEATDPPLDRSFFFYDSGTGALLGTWTLPRAQGPTENCTLHNYNVIPTKKRNILVSGNYQAGTWVVDFTNPAAAFTVAGATRRRSPFRPERSSAAT
jgi:hypothetical protein